MTGQSYNKHWDTGISWIGPIPAAWDVLRVKHCTYVKGRVGWKGLTSDEYLDEGHAYLVTGTDFRSKFIDWEDCYRVDEERYNDDPFIQLKNGDLLITKDGTIGKLAVVSNLSGPACLNSGIFLVRPLHSYTSEFLFWVLSSDVFKLFCDLTSYGSTIQHLYQNVFENFAFPVPSLPEQTAIVTFLDRETAKIDALVEEQKRLIELLKEERQAAISHAVTKGLNPGAPMKDTGIVWLGEVPEHWEVVPLKHLTAPGRDIMYGIVLPGPNVEGGVPIVKGGDVRLHKLKVELLNRTTAEIERPFARARLLPNDIVYSIRGTIGDAELVPEELRDANITQDVARIAPREGLNNAWLLYALKSHEIFAQLEVKSLGAAVRGINIFDLKRARIPVPPREEQDAIADYLFEKTRELDQLLSTAQSSINLLQERRAALISAAVTGKIDVRGQSTSTAVTPDFRRSRKLVAAKIVEDLSDQKTFGRVKLQKLLYLAEAHGGVHELSGHYVREAAGPLDRDMVREVETALQVSGHVVIEQPEGRGTAVNYQLRGTRGAFEAELQTLLGDRISALSELIEKVGALDTRGAEAVATLYAVWNDALGSGTVPSDDEIIREVLNDWHPKKAETFTVADLKHWLAWMRRNGLKPKGNAPVTSTGRLFV